VAKKFAKRSDVPAQKVQTDLTSQFDNFFLTGSTNPDKQFDYHQAEMT
jgi:hypothetical protein